MSKVKIGDKEYELKSLSSLDLKKIDEMKKNNDALKDEDKLKLSDYDQTFNTLLYAIKKFNPEAKEMNLTDFMESFPLIGIWNKIKEIYKITGLSEENLEVGVGKK